MARKPPRTDFSFNAESLLAEMPTVSYICENDEFYTMRYISSSILLTLGYQADEFIDNAKVFAAAWPTPKISRPSTPLPSPSFQHARP